MGRRRAKREELSQDLPQEPGPGKGMDVFKNSGLSLLLLHWLNVVRERYNP